VIVQYGWAISNRAHWLCFCFLRHVVLLSRASSNTRMIGKALNNQSKYEVLHVKIRQGTDRKSNQESDPRDWCVWIPCARKNRMRRNNLMTFKDIQYQMHDVRFTEETPVCSLLDHVWGSAGKPSCSWFKGVPTISVRGLSER
jgi:hypothetical protein